MALKWGVIGQGLVPERYQKLKSLVDTKGMANEVVIVESTIEKFVADLKSLCEQVECLRIERPFYNNVLSLIVEYPVEISFLNFADSMLKKNGHWWMRSLLCEALRRLVVKSGVEYEPTGKVLVVGSGGAARACVYGLAGLGFLSIHVIDRDFNASRDLIKSFEHNIFKVELNALPPENVGLIPPQYTLVVNTTPETPENLLIKEIAYFNFILEGAMLIDLAPEATSKSFLGESKTLNVHRFGGESIGKYCDLVWLEQAFGLSLQSGDL